MRVTGTLVLLIVTAESHLKVMKIKEIIRKLLMVEQILPVSTIENSWTTLWRICMCCDVLI